MVAVLDNFHFDLSSVTSEDIKPHPNTAPPTDSPVSTPSLETGEIAAVLGEQEEAMEVDEQSHPSNKNQGMTSVKKILASIIRTIIPSLQKVLTKRVSLLKI